MQAESFTICPPLCNPSCWHSSQRHHIFFGAALFCCAHSASPLFEILSSTDVQQLEQMSTQFIYQYYTQRGLSSDQLVYMQRVTNELYLRTKPDRGVIDPAQLIYQFSRKLSILSAFLPCLSPLFGRASFFSPYLAVCVYSLGLLTTTPPPPHLSPPPTPPLLSFSLCCVEMPSF